MDLRLRQAQQDWLSQGDVTSGVRVLDAEDLSPLEALTHPWLTSRELRLAYGERLAGRGDPLGEWIAASTRLEDPEGLSLEDEWDLRQRAWTLLDAHGESWTQGQRSSYAEFTRGLDHPWRLVAGRLEPCPWKVTPEVLGDCNRSGYEARGAPRLEISPDFEVINLRSFANLVVERPWFRALRTLEVRLQEDWLWTEEDEAAAEADYEAFSQARDRAQREADPPVDLRSLASLLPDLREFRLRGADFLPGWVSALSARLEAFACAGGAAELDSVLRQEWPRLRRLEVGSYGSMRDEDPTTAQESLERGRFPRLEELDVARVAPASLGTLAGQLRHLSLSAPVPMTLGSAPTPASGEPLSRLIRADLCRLRSLGIYSYRTSGWLLKRLAGLPALRSLDLGNTGLDNLDARFLAELEGLRSLSVGHSQPLNGKGLSLLLAGPVAKTLRELDISGGHGCCGPGRSHYPLGGAEALHACRGHGLTSLSLPYLTRRSARVLATAPALRSLCSLKVKDLRADPEAIHEALNEKATFRLTKFEVESPKSDEEEEKLRALWGSRYVDKRNLMFFNF